MMRPMFTLLGAAALGCAVVAAPASAADPTEQIDPDTGTPSYYPKWDDGTLSIQVENDKFGFSGTDQHYTNGLHATWLSGTGDMPIWAQEVGNALPFFPTNSIKRYSLSFGQSIFTPSDTQADDADPDDRPYAGWTYIGLGYLAETGNTLDRLEIDLGVVGPWALGEETQNNFHSLIGVDTAKGWGSQLHNEPGAVLYYERMWRALGSFKAGGLGFDFSPHAGAALGNVYTYAAGGGTVRVGFNLPDDYGPPRIRPSLPGSTQFEPTGGLGGYLFAGVEGRAVARNIFLDGNTFRDSPSVDKKIFVGDVQAGVAVTLGNTRVTYTQAIRSPEFDGQDKPDIFGSISLSYRF
ncbi:hypothetical protein CKO38_13870 [Rhodospirillum rubrum]|uniref:lipid A deacylase LpxR family protein n=1 Tax=Rhodospirillum rubrum TaxID=1085 RepID=UPI0019066157|nr:lipid A deacylase LpxR family protein [Rhodospirillum rubrum]MBK1665627.1 hypothetical protein [Rhodospirillum rubrum]MBK1677735.1 hypothetical protein [Rhodospirillum rubrum]